MSIALLIKYSHARIGLQTINDGVTYNYNTFLNFSGQTGLKLAEPIVGLQTYSLSIWVRLDAYPWDTGQDMVVIYLYPEAFSCQFLARKKLECRSDRGSTMTVGGDPRIGQWYIIIIRARSDFSQVYLRELSYNQVSVDQSKSFFPFGYTTLAFQRVYLGVSYDERSSYLQGSIRNFRLFSAYYDDATLRNLQFILLYPYPDLQIQLILNGVNDISSVTSRATAQAVGRNNVITQAIDFNGVWWCWSEEPITFPSFQKFDNTFAFQKYSISNSAYNTGSNFDSTFQMWFLRSNIQGGDRDETLFNHDQVIQMIFLKNDYYYLTLNGRSSSNNKVYIPFNKWVYLQVIVTQTYFTVYLADSNGRLMNSLTTTYSSSTSNSLDVYIATNFNGFIKGMKYFKIVVSPPSAYVMSFPQYDSSPNCLLFSQFINDGYDSSSSTFINLAVQYFSNKIALTSSSRVNFVQQYFFEMNQVPNTGSLKQSVDFDTYTCGDKKEKLYLTSQNSYAQTTITIDQVATNFTIEFWIKLPGGQTQNSYIMTLAESNNKRKQYLAIMQERQSLICYPFYNIQSQGLIKLSYSDYSTDNTNWMHIACIYDSVQGVVRGDLYYNSIDYVYQGEVVSKLTIDKKEYLLTVNTDPNSQSEGIQKTYFGEVRFWKVARTVQQISDYRQHQLYIDVERPKLFSYMKMFNGGFTKASEIDFADPALNKLVRFSGHQWITESSILICPQFMFRGTDPATCYREGILSLNLIFVRRENDYLITPFFSKYRNSYLRNQAQILYDFQWNVVRVETQYNDTDRLGFPQMIASQLYNNEIKIRQDQVAQNPGAYRLSLTVKDKNKAQDDYIAEIRFKTLNCLKLFDFETKSSFVYLDIDKEKETQDIYFKYGYTECRDYYFSPKLLVYSFDQDGLLFNADDHNIYDQTIRIRQQIQSKLPLNEYFYVKVTGLWTYKGDTSNTIEITMIYALRYITMLSLNINADSKILLLGQTLTLTSDGTKIINLSLRDPDRDSKTFTLQWQCPGKLNTFCSKQTGSTLKITDTVFQDSGLPYWQSTNITLIGNTNFLQGNGIKQSQKILSIVWLPVNPDVVIMGPEKPISRDSNAYTIKIKNLKSEREQENIVAIKWTMTPSVDIKYLPNSNNRKQFVLDSYALQEGQNYQIFVEINYVSQGTIIWNGLKMITVPINPSKGSMSVTPNSGTAYQTQFKLSALNWNIQQGPIKYQYFYESTNQTKVPITPIINSEYLTNIPATKKIFLRVSDANEAYTYQEFQVNIALGSNSTTAESLNSISDQIIANPQIEPTQLLTLSTLFSSALPLADKIIDQNKIQQSITLISDNIHDLSQQAASTTDVSLQKFIIQSSVQTLALLSNSTELFNISNAVTQQNAVNNLMGNENLFEYFKNDPSFNQNFVQIQGNLLNSLKSLQNEGQIDIGNTNAQIANITDKMRDIITNFEEYWSTQIYESQNMTFNTSSFSLSIQKFSRIANALSDQILSLNNSQIQFTFPLQTADEPTERQSFSVMVFQVSPFLGSSFFNQSILSNSSVFFAYRDQDGNYLGQEYINGTIDITFKYDYQEYQFLPNKTVCGYINVNDTQWQNENCQIQFDRESSMVKCQCKHMSFYSVIEDNLIRPSETRILYLSFRNWPSFIVFLYVVFIFILGVIYSYNKDNQDFKALLEQEESQGSQLTKPDAINIVSHAFRRKVFFMGFTEGKFSFKKLFQIYIMLLHPILQLKYKLDPSLPRFYKFMYLYTRIVIIMLISYLALRNHPSIESLDKGDRGVRVFLLIVYIILLSIILIPLPILFMPCFKTKYYLNFSQGSPQISDDGYSGSQKMKKSKKQKGIEEKVYIDPNLPIKLLFLINAVPLEEIKKNHREKIPFASGRPFKVGDKLKELDFSIASDSGSEVSSSEESGSASDKQKQSETVDTRKQISANVQEVKSEKKNLLMDDHFNIQNQTDAHFLAGVGHPSNIVNHTDIQFELRPKGQDAFFENSRINNSPNQDKSYHELVKQDLSQVQQVQSSKFNNENVNEEEESSSPSQTNESRSNQEEIYQSGENVDDDSQDEHHEGGEMEFEPQQHQVAGSGHLNQNRGSQAPGQQQESQESESQNTDMYIDEKKELLQDTNHIGRLIGFFFLLLINAGSFFWVISLFISEKFYNAESQESYVWVIVFFLSQIVGFLITDFIALIIMAAGVFYCCKKRKTCLTIFMKDSLVLYEDYKYVVQFTQTKLL